MPTKRADNFIVSLSNMGDQEPVCYFEYSKSQIEEIRSSGLDGQTPWTYKEMENYLKLQRSSLKMRGTNKNCGERGVIISNTNTRKISMNKNDEVSDRTIGRASCARTCYAENERRPTLKRPGGALPSLNLAFWL